MICIKNVTTLMNSFFIEGSIFIFISLPLGSFINLITRSLLPLLADQQSALIISFFVIVSGRLESPNHLVRKMASNIALALSKIIDPKNPLYLDDSCNGETIDWAFGFTDPKKRTLTASNSRKKGVEEIQISTFSSSEEGSDSLSSKEKGISVRDKKKLLDFNVLDPDEIVDPASLNLELDINDEDNDDSASENSCSSDDSSLQPYDLSDDDSDLKKTISQLSDVVAALRKSDDADGVCLFLSEHLLVAF
jgi:telomere length regulation protein